MTNQSEAERNGKIVEALLAFATDELRKPPADADDGSRIGAYRRTPAGFMQIVESRDGFYEKPLTNFNAQIINNVSRDDGAEVTRGYEIKLSVDGREIPVSIPTAQFAAMRWPRDAAGTRALVMPGQGTVDQARYAIELFSSAAGERVIYAHTGWRVIEGINVYLHSDGAIGAFGEVEGVEVSLPPELAAFRLELPDDPAAVIAAIRASLGLLGLGPDRITIPAYGSILRAIIGGADFNFFLYGRTGTFKTEFASLAQAHFGAGFNARNVPTTFISSANTNEALAFIAKDALLLVDELHPPENGPERDRMYRDAARVLRSQGNLSGRGRMRADGSLRPAKPPRGLLFATGEDLPRGQSVAARMITVEVRAGDIDPLKLKTCQEDAARGLYARATGTFVKWLAPRLDEVRREFEASRQEVRTYFTRRHPRTADIQGQLVAAYQTFLTFLFNAGVVDRAEAEQLQVRVRVAIDETGSAQAQFAERSEPTRAFLRLLQSSLAAGKAHLANPDGNAPFIQDQDNNFIYLGAACGWRDDPVEKKIQRPAGVRIGWIEIKEGFVYLDRDVAYQVAQQMAVGGESVEVSPFTLTKRLYDAGLLVTTDLKTRRETYTVQRVFEGRRCSVLHFRAESLSIVTPLGPLSSQEPEQPEQLSLNGTPPARVSARKKATSDKTRVEKSQ